MIEAFLLSSIDAQSTPEMSHFSFKMQFVRSSARSSVSRRKTLIAWPFGILVVLQLELNLRKNEKSSSSSVVLFFVKWTYLRIT